MLSSFFGNLAGISNFLGNIAKCFQLPQKPSKIFPSSSAILQNVNSFLENLATDFRKRSPSSSENKYNIFQVPQEPSQVVTKLIYCWARVWDVGVE
jgi:hypothetical protein